jgi:hypothetical protein
MKHRRDENRNPFFSPSQFIKRLFINSIRYRVEYEDDHEWWVGKELEGSGRDQFMTGKDMTGWTKEAKKTFVKIVSLRAEERTYGFPDAKTIVMF